LDEWRTSSDKRGLANTLLLSGDCFFARGHLPAAGRRYRECQNALSFKALGLDERELTVLKAIIDGRLLRNDYLQADDARTQGIVSTAGDVYNDFCVRMPPILRSLREWKDNKEVLEALELASLVIAEKLSTHFGAFLFDRVSVLRTDLGFPLALVDEDWNEWISARLAHLLSDPIGEILSEEPVQAATLDQCVESALEFLELADAPVDPHHSDLVQLNPPSLPRACA
jgi:hypothetical protein